jgi:hypothetical protein
MTHPRIQGTCVDSGNAYRTVLEGIRPDMVLKILLIPMAIGAIFYGWYRNDLRRLTRDYACKEPFDGALEGCIIRFPLDEASTDTVLGANGEGLAPSLRSILKLPTAT